jgi:hypothetical protein
MADKIDSYAAFWPHYLRAHRDPRTRFAHHLGTVLALALVLLAAAGGDWRVLAAAPLAGYGCAWLSHAVFEGNQPTTFGRPLWSFYSDFRMLALWASGRLEPELDKALRS